MLPVRFRLVMGYLIVLIIGMGLAAALAWFSVEALYMSTQQENLLAQAKVIAAAIGDQKLPLQPIEPYNQASNTAPGIHTRILGEQGGVIFSLPMLANQEPVSPPSAENAGFIPQAELLQREEIQLALSGVPATAIRQVPSANNRKVLYASAPIRTADGLIVGIVYLASPLPSTGVPVNIFLQLLGAVIFAIVLASIFGAFVARSIALPIEVVARAAQAVAQGKLSESIPVNREIIELNRLGQAFNAMTVSLRQSEKTRDAFIADVTHELRTPLTVIKGTIETLEDGALDDIAGRGALLVSMQSETDRLIRLVHDLLVLTRADSGALNLNIQQLDLGLLVRSRSDYFSVLAGPRRIKLRVVNDVSEKIMVCADHDRVIQVFDNLLDNAIRYSPDDSSVEILISINSDEGCCTLTDHGVGISEKHLPYIFDRFYRVDASRDRQTGGSGLGLAIVRTLVVAQNGHVFAASTEKQGTTISFSLPLANKGCHPVV